MAKTIKFNIGAITPIIDMASTLRRLGLCSNKDVVKITEIIIDKVTSNI